MSLQYSKTFIKEGTAYIQNQFINEAKNTSNFLKTFQLSEFVISDNNEFTKARYPLNDLVEIYLIVNSSPFLSKLIRAYGKAKKIISKI